MLDARQASKLNIKFDRVLLDAPCSGNFAADRDWFRNRTLKDVERNAALQRELLAQAVDCLNDEGEIVYSTCSLEPEEDELNIDWALKNLNVQVEQITCHGEKGSTNIFGEQLDPSIKYCKRLWPGETQGFFVCRLRKVTSQ
jgi:16S rRNA C967 or C1407 C5-methylase (RsmB/RsmF family)